MSEIQTAYNPGGFTISSERAPGGAGGGGIDSFFLDLIRKKKAWEDAFNQRRLASMDADLGDRERARYAGTNQPRERQASQLDRMREASEIEKLRSEMTPPQVDPFSRTVDPIKLNLHERRYLPAQAQFASGGLSSSPPSTIAPQEFASWTEADSQGAGRAAGDKAWEAAQAQRLALLRKSAAEPTYGEDGSAPAAGE